MRTEESIREAKTFLFILIGGILIIDGGLIVALIVLK